MPPAHDLDRRRLDGGPLAQRLTIGREPISIYEVHAGSWQHPRRRRFLSLGRAGRPA
jgi:1,4-alpha-glucan branching enzyme